MGKNADQFLQNLYTRNEHFFEENLRTSQNDKQDRILRLRQRYKFLKPRG
jgi:hypothetical protein